MIRRPADPDVLGAESAIQAMCSLRHIATVDADGVALAAIQGLNAKVESGKQNAQSLEQRIEQQETEITELKQRLEKLEQLLEHTLIQGGQ